MVRTAKPSGSTSNVVSLDAHAKETLRYIRSSMDAATLVATPGSAGIAIGLVGVIAALVSMGPWRAHWPAIWLASAPVACLSGAFVMARQQRLQARTLLGASGRRFVLCLAPALTAGAALTAVELRDGLSHLLAGTWLILYGTGVMAASAMAIRLITWLGAIFLLMGMAALWLPENLYNLLLGAGFGGLHLLAGVYLLGRGSHES